MSKLTKKNLIASAIAGVFALSASNIASATTLTELQKSESKTYKASAKSQKK